MPSESATPSAPRVHLTIDGGDVAVPVGSSVLRAAELAGIEIPALCSHPELSPFGGCRLCAVEIDGLSGRPLACSTIVADGMRVASDSVELQAQRRQILQLILAAHPSSCLVCDEQDDCARSQSTIRKAGVSTGCRNCPSDGACELQRVARHIGVEELEFPVTYRGLPAEHDDPFFDRDYNLCILCGRCIRMCDEVRGVSVLAFTYRGRRAKVGPAFERSHVEAGCEFCGACVAVCPTGALAVKASKWDGPAGSGETSTCPFCGLGCRIELRHKDGQLSEVLGARDAEVNDGQLCVRGRFCLPETTHHPDRTRTPMLRRGPYLREVDWDLALAVVAEQLADCPQDELLMLASPDLTNESLYAAQHFVREVLGSGGIDSTARDALPGGPALWSRLFGLPISLRAVAEADVVVSAGLATRFSFSVAGVQIRRAVRRGARLIVIDARESSLARAAEEWVRPPAGGEAAALVDVLASGTAAHEGERLAVVVGPRVFHSLGAAGLPAALETAAARGDVTILPLTHGANVRGALELGALNEVRPGPRPASAGAHQSGASLEAVLSGRRPRVVYLVGEAPFTTRPDCDYLIAQDLRLPPFQVDAFLPAASFAEAGGTLTNLEGRVQEVRAVESAADTTAQPAPRPDWRIFSGLARELASAPLEGERLGSRELDVASSAGVRAAIRREVSCFPAEGDRSPRRMAPLELPRGGAGSVSGTANGPGTIVPETLAAAAAGEATSDGHRGRRVMIVPEPPAFRHRGFDLADVVEGLAELRLEEGLRMHPDDLARLRVEAGGMVTVVLDGRDLLVAARPDEACPRGAAYLSRTPAWRGPAAPVPVRVRAGDRTRRSRISPLTSAVRSGGGDDGQGR